MTNETPRRVKSGVASVVAAQAQAEGYQVTLYAVRQFVKQNKLNVTYCGRKALINYASLLDLLDGKE
ncbi:MAG: hypothetical protein FWH26_04115 [Oscillospiraceae bacterium]|nr:hypothetical protein [Oscillospiraceae bacterium]